MGDKVLIQSEVDALINGLAVPKANPLAAGAAKPVFSASTTPAAATPPQPARQNGDDPALPRVREVTLSAIRPAAPPAETVAQFTARIEELSRRLAVLEDQVTHQPAAANTQRLTTTPEVNRERFEMFSNRVEEMGGGYKILQARLQATLGYDVYHSFQCDKCGSKNYVATLFKCTKCGGESWRGWWPKKSSK